MNLISLLFLAIGLSMDAFAVAICKGLAIKNMRFSHALVVGLYFGVFQAVMPLIGYLLGSRFTVFITSIDHWIAFILLSLIGFNMLKEAWESRSGCDVSINNSLDVKTMTTLAIATSIDALAVGITFAFLEVNIFAAVSFIGIITCVLSIAGVYIGNGFGCRFKSWAEFAGGAILIILGIKILIEHLFF